MKMIEFALSMTLTVFAVVLGFGCALGIASVWLRSVMSAMTRNSYNVSSVSDRRLAADAGVRVGADVL